MNDDPLHEWLACPECGYDEFTYVPTTTPGHNSYLECPECGNKAVLVG